CWRALSEPELSPVVPFFAWLMVFGLTCLLEAPFYLTALRGTGHGWGKRLIALLLPNLATHPLVYFVIPWVVSRFEGPHIVTLTVGEIFAPLAEAALLARIWKVR